MNIREKTTKAVSKALTLAILALLFLNVLPAFPVNDIRNACNTHIERIGKCNAACSFIMEPSYCLDSLFCKESKRMLLALRATSFSNHVLSIFFSRTKPKMLWIDAISYIAFMKNLFPRRNWTSKQFPRETMNIDLSWDVMPMIKLSVAIMGKNASPQPAGASFFNAPPKKEFSALRRSIRPAFSTTPSLWFSPEQVTNEFLFAS
jgi:hypothetical protein